MRTRRGATGRGWSTGYPLLPWLMARQHLDHLRAQHLADDDAGRVVPAGAAHQLCDGQPAVAVRVGQHLLQLHDVGVQLRVPAQPQLQRPFHRDQPLLAAGCS